MVQCMSWKSGMRQVVAAMVLGTMMVVVPQMTVAAGMPRGEQSAEADRGPVSSVTASRFEQVPGIQHQQIGQLQVTAFLDGVIPLPLSLLKGIDPAQVQALVRRAHMPQVAAGVQTAVNVFLVRRGERLMLIDAGGGSCLGENLGHLRAHLQRAGIDPADVTDVLLTHAHPDHVCGLVDARGQSVFARATLWMPTGEAAFWLSQTQKARAPKDKQGSFDAAVRAVEPYRQAGRLQLVGADTQLPPGVQRVATPGHTADHVSWLVDSGTEEAPSGSASSAASPDGVLFWGDIVHFHGVQFPRPGAWVDFDAQARLAVESRRKVLRLAARHGWWVAGAHLPFPGIGHVERDGKAWRWVRTEFVPVTDAGGR